MSAALESRGVSDRLMLPLRQIIGRTRFLRAARAFLITLLLVGVTWLPAAIVLGNKDHLALPIRVIIAAACWLVALAALFRIFLPATRKPAISTAARMLDDAGDRQELVTSAVSIANEPDNPHKGSRQLIAALMGQAEKEAESVQPQNVISSATVVKLLLACLPVAVTWLVFIAIQPHALANGIQRLFLPWDANTPIPTIDMEIEPGDKQIAQGENIEINLTVSPPKDADPLKKKSFNVSRATITSYFSGGQRITSDMERTGPRTFRTRHENVQQTFRYVITADDQESRAFVISILPRPTLLNADITYTYPLYTQRKQETLTAKDGSLEGIVGTQAAVTFHLSENITAESKLILKTAESGGGKERETSLSLIPRPDKTAIITLDLRNSGKYELDLVSADNRGLRNYPAISRTVTVKTDLKPDISILSPGESTNIRPSDTAEIVWQVKDDFSVTLVEALITIDGKKQPAEQLLYPRDIVTELERTWKLDITKLIDASGMKNPKRITYVLRAVDNAQPTAQENFTKPHHLILDPNAGSIQEERDKALAGDLESAQKKNQEALERAQKTVDELKKEEKPLSADERKQLEPSRKEVASSTKDLSKAAKEKFGTNFDSAARSAAEAAKKSEEAAEAMARAEGAQTGSERKNLLEDASQKIAAARNASEQARKDLDENATERQTKNKLEDLLERQRKLAEKMRSDPANMEKYKKEQEEIAKEIDKLRQNDPELSGAAERLAESENRAIANRARQNTAGMSELTDRANARADAENAPAEFEQIRKDQKELAGRSQAFADQNKDLLKQAGATPPDKNRMDEIDRDLQRNKAAEAGRGQNFAADRFKDTAEKLQKLGDIKDHQANYNKGAADRAQAMADKAGELKKRADDNQQELAKSKADGKAPTKPNDPFNDKQRELSREIQKAAATQDLQNPSQQKNTAAAAKDAQAAIDAANNNKPEEAARLNQQAAGKLKEATDAINTQAQQAASNAPGKAARDAAQEARNMEAKERQLADQTQRVGDTVQKSAEASANPDQTRQQQEKTADALDKAAQESEAAARKNESGAPKASRSARQSAEDFRKAASQQRQAARSEQSGNTQDAARQQQAAQDSANEGISKMGGQSRQSSQQNSGQAQSGNQNQNSGQNSQQNSEQAAQQDIRPAPADGAGSENAEAQAISEANKDFQDMTEAMNESAAKGDPAAAKRAADRMQAAAEKYSKIIEAKRGQNSGESANQKSTAQNQNGAKSENAGGQSQNAAASANSGTGNSSGQSNADPSSQNKPDPNAPPKGMQLGNNPDDKKAEIPESIKELGINPSDWIKLSPEMQSQLLTASQQKGPPAYRSAIKDYYTRLAKMKSE